jgi:hypothetical protein
LRLGATHFSHLDQTSVSVDPFRCCSRARHKARCLGRAHRKCGRRGQGTVECAMRRSSFRWFRIPRHWMDLCPCPALPERWPKQPHRRSCDCAGEDRHSPDRSGTRRRSHVGLRKGPTADLSFSWHCDSGLTVLRCDLSRRWHRRSDLGTVRQPEIAVSGVSQLIPCP